MTVKDIENEKIVFYHKPGDEEKVISLRKLGSPSNERRRTLSQAKVQADIDVCVILGK